MDPLGDIVDDERAIERDITRVRDSVDVVELTGDLVPVFWSWFVRIEAFREGDVWCRGRMRRSSVDG